MNIVMDRIGKRTIKGNARFRVYASLSQARKARKDGPWAIYRGTGKMGTTAKMVENSGRKELEPFVGQIRQRPLKATR